MSTEIVFFAVFSAKTLKKFMKVAEEDINIFIKKAQIKFGLHN
jgi:hypothetical protein